MKSGSTIRRCLHLAVLGGALFACALAGCSDAPNYEFDELDLVPTQNNLVEFSLGHYEIPVPMARGGGDGTLKRNRVELSFDLYVLTTRDYEAQLADMWQRHEGNIRDVVIRVCRNASPDDLQEAELATLKSHLTDAIQAQLGAKSIRRLMFSEVQTRGI